MEDTLIYLGSTMERRFHLVAGNPVTWSEVKDAGGGKIEKAVMVLMNP